MKIKTSKTNVRQDPIASRTRKQKNKQKEESNIWVSATNTHNYMLNDGICDWLKMYGKSENIIYKKTNNDKYENKFTHFIMNKGNDFEHKVIKYLKTKFRCIKVADFYSVSDANKTFEFMKQGIPIICSAPVYNNHNKTYGIIDLLVRSDYINKIFTIPPIPPQQEKLRAPNLQGDYHYRVIDIKYSTLNLSSDGIHLTNSFRVPAYKSQLYIYNEAISNFQGYNPMCAYIMGRRWKCVKEGVDYYGERCDDRLGVIDFHDYDYDYVDKSKDAIAWYRNVVKNGVNWTVYPPTNNELYPNMCIDSYKHNKMKHKVSNNLGEISMLWNCGVSNRNLAIEQGICSWKDRGCNSRVLGFDENSKNGIILDSIIRINRDSDEMMLPKKLSCDYFWLNEEENEMFVDFETFNDICMDNNDIPYQKRYNFIYMIGVGIKQNGKWSYKSFIANNISKLEEKNIINQFMTYYNTLHNPPVYYWSAENTLFKTACRYHNLKYNVNWLDMCDIFKTEPISLKGCFGFGLKEISKTMYKNKMISTHLESECNNGMMAMIKAWKCYKNSNEPINSPVMKDIEKYNEFDCQVMYDILNYLRNKYKIDF